MNNRRFKRMLHALAAGTVTVGLIGAGSVHANNDRWTPDRDNGQTTQKQTRDTGADVDVSVNPKDPDVVPIHSDDLNKDGQADKDRRTNTDRDSRMDRDHQANKDKMDRINKDRMNRKDKDHQAAADSDIAEAELILLTFGADWCEKSDKMDKQVRKLEDSFQDQPILVVDLDMTDKQSKKQAEYLV
jgi:hypothetical protein